MKREREGAGHKERIESVWFSSRFCFFFFSSVTENPTIRAMPLLSECVSVSKPSIFHRSIRCTTECPKQQENTSLLFGISRTGSFLQVLITWIVMSFL